MDSNVTRIKKSNTKTNHMRVINDMIATGQADEVIIKKIREQFDLSKHMANKRLEEAKDALKVEIGEIDLDKEKSILLKRCDTIYRKAMGRGQWGCALNACREKASLLGIKKDDDIKNTNTVNLVITDQESKL